MCVGVGLMHIRFTLVAVGRMRSAEPAQTNMEATMALNFNRVAAQAAAAQAQTQASQQASNVAQMPARETRVGADGKVRPKADFYINLGAYIPVEMEDGTIENVFVTLPFGLELDTMNDANNSGPVMNAAKNAMRDLVKHLVSPLGQGETMMLNEHTCPIKLEIEVRRRGNKNVDASTNPILAAMQAMIDAKVAG